MKTAVGAMCSLPGPGQQTLEDDAIVNRILKEMSKTMERRKKKCQK